MIPGPDYPGGAQIISTAEEIAAIYRGGRGSLRVRAKWKIENLARGQWRLVITELPPGVSTNTVMSEIEACSNPVAKEKAGQQQRRRRRLQPLDRVDALVDEPDVDEPEAGEATELHGRDA